MCEYSAQPARIDGTIMMGAAVEVRGVYRGTVTRLFCPAYVEESYRGGISKAGGGGISKAEVQLFKHGWGLGVGFWVES